MELQTHNHNRLQLCYLVDFGPLACESIPQDNGTLIVTAGQEVFVIAAPADTAATEEKNRITLTQKL